MVKFIYKLPELLSFFLLFLLFITLLLTPLYNIECIYKFWGYFCHQLPQRSFMIFNNYLPLCSRCVGICSGTLFGSILFIAIKPSPEFLSLLLFSMLPMSVDLLGVNFSLWEGTNLIRFLTGSGFGIGMYGVLEYFFVKLRKSL